LRVGVCCGDRVFTTEELPCVILETAVPDDVIVGCIIVDEIDEIDPPSFVELKFDDDDELLPSVRPIPLEAFVQSCASPKRCFKQVSCLHFGQ
jgi:hypothetical protein